MVKTGKKESSESSGSDSSEKEILNRRVKNGKVTKKKCTIKAEGRKKKPRLTKAEGNPRHQPTECDKCHRVVSKNNLKRHQKLSCVNPTNPRLYKLHFCPLQPCWYSNTKMAHVNQHVKSVHGPRDENREQTRREKALIVQTRQLRTAKEAQEMQFLRTKVAYANTVKELERKNKLVEELTGVSKKPLGIDDIVNIVGEHKGIQGCDTSSSFYDAILVALFAFCGDFDEMLNRKHAKDSRLVQVQQVLRDNIVYPLRNKLLVRSDVISDFRLRLTDAKIHSNGDESEMWNWLSNFLFALLPMGHKVAAHNLEVSSQCDSIGQMVSKQKINLSDATNLLLHIPLADRKRADEVKKIAVTPMFKSSDNKKFAMFAVVAAEEDHFVTFVHAGDSHWLKFDSLSEQHPTGKHFVPEVWTVEGLEKLGTVEDMANVMRTYKKVRFLPLHERLILCQTVIALYKRIN